MMKRMMLSPRLASSPLLFSSSHSVKMKGDRSISTRNIHTPTPQRINPAAPTQHKKKRRKRKIHLTMIFVNLRFQLGPWSTRARQGEGVSIYMQSGSRLTPTELLTYTEHTTHFRSGTFENEKKTVSESLALHSGMVRQIGPLHPVDDGRRARVPLGPLV